MTIDSNSDISEAMLESWHLTEILSVDLADTTGSPASVFGTIDDFTDYFNLDRDEVLRQLLAFAGLGKIGDLAFGFNNLCSMAKLQKLKDSTPEELQRKYLPNILSLGTSSVGDDLPFATVLMSEKGPGAPTSWHEAIAKLRSKTFGEKVIDKAEMAPSAPCGLIIDFAEDGSVTNVEKVFAGLSDLPIRTETTAAIVVASKEPTPTPTESRKAVDLATPGGTNLFVGASDAEVITHTEDLKRKFSPDGLDWPITQSCIGPRVVMQGSHWLPNPTQPISAQVKDVDISGLYSETIPSTHEPLGLNFGSDAGVALKEAPPTEEDYNVLDLRSVTDDEPES